MQFGQVHHIEYYVNDLQKSNEFYDWFMPKMGHEKFQEFGDGVSYRHATGTYIVFVQVQKQYLDHDNNRQGNGLNHLAFMGGEESELDQLEKELRDRKINITKRDGPYLCFEDPNNFAIEVYAK